MRNALPVIITLSILALVLLFVLPHVYSDVTVDCLFGKGIDVNLFLPVGIVLVIVVAGIAGFSFWPGKQWWPPSLLFIVVGLGIAVIVTLLAYKDSMTTSSPKEQADLAQLVLTAGGFVVAIFAIILTALGLFFASKMQKVDQIDGIRSSVFDLTVSSAELAFASLPDFSRTQQIPHESHESLRLICGTVFNPQSVLFQLLEEERKGTKKERKGTKLVYANGLRLFGDNDVSKAVNEFKKVSEDEKASSEEKSHALYWLGVAYRQLGLYRQSVGRFEELAKLKEATRRDLLKARFGAAVTLFAAHKHKHKRTGKRWWDTLKWARQNEMLENVRTAFKDHIPSFVVPHGDILKEYADRLICGVLEEQKENPVAKTYLVKIRCYDWEAKRELCRDPQVREHALEVLGFLRKQAPESPNIRASYHLVCGLLNLYLCHLPPPADQEGRDQGQAKKEWIEEAKKAFELAGAAADEYDMLTESHAYIFSEKRDIQVHVDGFRKEVGDYLEIANDIHA